MLNSLSHPQVKSALDAWQQNNLPAWLEHFTADVKLFDDGSPRDFMKFSREIGKERFTSIDKVEDGGMSVFGHFHSDQWGDFKTYFKFCHWALEYQPVVGASNPATFEMIG